MKLVPDGWRWPRAVTHVLDSESKSVGFGYQVFYAATYGAMVARKGKDLDVPVLDSDKWMWATLIASVLVAGKLGKEMLTEFLKHKYPKEAPPDAPAAPAQ